MRQNLGLTARGNHDCPSCWATLVDSQSCFCRLGWWEKVCLVQVPFRALISKEKPAHAVVHLWVHCSADDWLKIFSRALSQFLGLPVNLEPSASRPSLLRRSQRHESGPMGIRTAAMIQTIYAFPLLFLPLLPPKKKELKKIICPRKETVPAMGAR